MTEEQDQQNQTETVAAEQARPALPPCCHSGCTVCVLDYPELFINREQLDTLAMLEAIERAQQAMTNSEQEPPNE